jgi:vacuolar-type H+-ATPase subunit H
MSDILEKLIGVERKATELVAEAEAEAGRRKSAARTEAGKLHAERIRDQAAALDRLVEERRTELSRERGEQNERYLKELEARSLHRDEFDKVLKPLLGIRR